MACDWAKEAIDDSHKSDSLDGNATPRRPTSSASRVESPMKVVALVVGIVAAAFWACYGVCAYRAYGVVFQGFMESHAASDASLMIRFVDLIDHENVPALRAKLLAIAKVSTDYSVPSPGYSLKALLRGPFESDSMEWTRDTTASQLKTARADITRLCQTSPATDTYRYVCGR